MARTSATDATTKPARHYVRVTGRRGRFVEFDYSIGSPELAVELIMPEQAFAEFCTEHHAVQLTPEECAQIDRERAEWRRKQVDTGDD
jgi:phenol hydroxylase P0 protein